MLLVLGGTVTAPRTLHAQLPARHRIAFLSGASRSVVEPSLGAFREGLRAFGYSENEIYIEERYADGHFERLPDLAADLVRLAPEIILAASPPVVRAVKQATSTIPVIMMAVADPVAVGFVASLAHPGGNITGLSTVAPDMAGKWVDLVKSAVPDAKRIAILLNPANPAYSAVLQGTQQSAQSLRIQLRPHDARAPDEIERAFAGIARDQVDALIVWGDPVFSVEKSRIIEFAASQKLPAIYQFREFVTAGGLMSYGPDLTDLYRRAAAYVDKILKGAKPAQLPVEQPTKFQLVINMKTAQMLNLTIPPLVLARSDEVIE